MITFQSQPNLELSFCLQRVLENKHSTLQNGIGKFEKIVSPYLPFLDAAMCSAKDRTSCKMF